MAIFRKHSDDTWEYRIRFKDKTGYKDFVKRGFQSKKEAELDAREMEKKLTGDADR